MFVLRRLFLSERTPMDLQALSSIDGFLSTCLLITAAICLLAVLVSWYTVRGRIQLSQIILGLFAFVLVMMLENIFSVAWNPETMPTTGAVYALYTLLSVVVSREAIRILIMKFGLVDRFRDTDSAIGFALGFGGLYLLTCAFYYFSLYTTVNEFLTSGAEAFFVNTSTDSQEAYDLLVTISEQTSWQYIFTGINRVFYMVREIALSVLVWYGLTDEKKRGLLILAPVMHLVAMVPDSLFGASIISNSYLKDVLTFILSGGIAFVAARAYNKNEDQVAHFKVEKLRARKRR